MSGKEDLLALREKIDHVDAELVRLFQQRMSISEDVAKVKAAANIAVVDEGREAQVLTRAAAAVSEANRADTLTFMRTLMALSKLRQHRKLLPTDPVSFPPPTVAKPEPTVVAFQGVPGAWSEQGAMRLFPGAPLIAWETFEDVFEAVRSGKADAGVLPIENTQTGAIGEVYDLLRTHGCYIVGQTWVPIAQCLLALDGARLSDIREVLSHPEGFGQCRHFLKGHAWDLTACRNTAYAAKLVAERQDKRCAAIGSRRAAEVHGLAVLSPDIMDSASNRTRFIAIAAEPAYDEACDTTSVTFSTAHHSGALCAVLQSFQLAGINLSRIESRPVSADRYRFFADLQANILDPRARDALRQAAMQCDYFEVLGCYPTAQAR